MSKHVRGKSGKMCISSLLSSKSGITATKIDANWWHSNLIYSTVKQRHMKISTQCVKACQRKVRKTVYFQYSKFQKGHNSHKDWRKLTKLKLDLKYSKTKSYAKFRPNMSKHVGEKCGKLCISSNLSSKRGITPTKMDGIWRHSNLIDCL